MEIVIGAPQLCMIVYLFLTMLMTAHYRERTETGASFVISTVIAYAVVILWQWWGGFWIEPKVTSWHAPQFLSALANLLSLVWAVYLVTGPKPTVIKGWVFLGSWTANITILAFGGFWGVRFIP